MQVESDNRKVCQSKSCCGFPVTKKMSLEGLLEQSVTARFVENLGVGTRMEEDGTYLLWSMRDYAMQYKKGRRWEL